ncbi:hypothetical protein LQW54_012446 [Pestalotiopsis sp. IQ-011]
MSSSNMSDSSRAEAIKELEYSIANWKIYVFEVEYKENFGLWDRHGRLRGEGYRVAAVLHALSKLPDQQLDIDGRLEEWSREIKGLIDYETDSNGIKWKHRGLNGCNDFLKKYCYT